MKTNSLSADRWRSRIAVNWRRRLTIIMTLATVLAQVPNIRVSDRHSTTPEEVTIAINPTNPLNLAAGANLNFIYTSYDGGQTWSQDQMTSTFGVWGDPCLVFDGNGTLYYGHLSNPPQGYWIDRIVVQKSSDGGITWNDGVGIGLNPPKVQDKEWLIADLTGSPFHNRLYMAWTEFDAYNSSDPLDSTRIRFAFSSDSGETWSSPQVISDRGGNCLDGDETVEGAVPAVGPQGQVYTSWAGPLGIIFDRSLDGGITFGTDIFVSAQPGGWAFDVPGIYRCNGLPITVCDISNSPYRGDIYICWSDQRNGIDDTDIFLKKSSDGGSTWSPTVRVNTDTTTRHQFFPWISVDPFTGIIYVVFYDRRNTTGNATEVWLARSSDGGETFTEEVISQTAFIPLEGIFFGDYINIAAWNGLVTPIWMRMDNGDLSVWTAIIHDTTAARAYPDDLLATRITLGQNYPNPFNPVTTIPYVLARDGLIRLTVHDLLGRCLTELVNTRQAAGRHTIQWDAREMESGLYFITLQSGKDHLTRRSLLVK